MESLASLNRTGAAQPQNLQNKAFFTRKLLSIRKIVTVQDSALGATHFELNTVISTKS